MKKRAVVALGGNALIKKGQMGTIYEQFANTRRSTQSIAKMISKGWSVVITHGNGPHVGAILLQNQAAKNLTPAMPLGICVAESEGLIGYMVQQCLSNALKKEQIEKPVVSLLAQVVVDKHDKALEEPTKPIGPYYNEKEALQKLKEGYHLVLYPQGWRMVVPSPDPQRIVEGDVIKRILDEDIVVITAGGGGMPVIERKNWGLDGIEAVIDKDLAAERLAESIEADVLVILTNVEKVYLHYKTKKQKPLNKVSLHKIKTYYEQGHFPQGSMGPKILAAIRFLEYGGEKVIISDIEKGWEAFLGKTGTTITRE
jgi:carbamate kinase